MATETWLNKARVRAEPPSSGAGGPQNPKIAKIQEHAHLADSCVAYAGILRLLLVGFGPCFVGWLLPYWRGRRRALLIGLRIG